MYSARTICTFLLYCGRWAFDENILYEKFHDQQREFYVQAGYGILTIRLFHSAGRMKKFRKFSSAYIIQTSLSAGHVEEPRDLESILVNHFAL
jgi:hypothetical protein